MEDKSLQSSMEASPEQRRYASILEKGMLIGLAILLVTFLLYAAGIMEPHVPMENLTELWKLNVGEYLEATGTSGGWSWATMLDKGDYLNFVGIALLAGVTIVCYASILPILWRNGDRAYVIIAVLEIVVLGLAASSLMNVGGH